MDRRVEALETRVARLEETLFAAGVRPAAPIPPPPHAAPPGVIGGPGPAHPPAAGAGVGAPTRPAPSPQLRRDREALLAGAWLARTGVAAVLLGVAFAFKYAVDRGLIGPTGRVLFGLVAGIAFVLWAERARARDWPRLAQALAGGGVGLAYLSVWAAFGLYELIPPLPAFAALFAVVAAGVVLALRHRSEALGLVALLGGFLSPYLTGIGQFPGPLFGYILLVDAGVAVLAVTRGWRLLEAKALLGTWIVAMAATEGVDAALVEAFAAAAFLLFAAVVLVRASGARRAEPTDPAFLSLNAVIFFGVSMVVLGEVAGAPRGELTLVLAGSHLGAGLLLRRFGWSPLLWVTFLCLGVGFATVAVPLQLEGFAVPIAWSLEGLALVASARGRDLAPAAWVGLGVVGLSLLDGVLFRMQLGFAYDPARPVLSIEALTLVVAIVTLYGCAALLRGTAAAQDAWSVVAWVAANLLTVTWFSVEARALVLDSGLPDTDRVVQFTLTAIWALYGGALLTLGIVGRYLGPRLLAIGLFAATVAKMVVVDVWLLQPLHRTIVFIGFGALLIAGSFLYHRFKELLLEGAPRDGA